MRRTSQRRHMCMCWPWPGYWGGGFTNEDVSCTSQKAIQKNRLEERAVPYVFSLLLFGTFHYYLPVLRSTRFENPMRRCTKCAKHTEVIFFFIHPLIYSHTFSFSKLSLPTCRIPSNHVLFLKLKVQLHPCLHDSEKQLAFSLVPWLWA